MNLGLAGGSRNRQTLVEELADRASAISVDAMDDTDVYAAQSQIVDAIGCCLSGGTSRLASVLSDYARLVGDEGTVDVIGIRRRLSPRLVVFAEATTTHVDEFDALHVRGAVGPAGPVVMPALLVGAMTHSDGTALLEAVVAGFEVMVEAAMRFGAASLYEQAWWPSAVFGALGTAAAVGRLLHLERDELAQALALATTRLGGLLSKQDLREGHYLLNGRSAEGGFDAAFLAAAGARADLGVLDEAAGVALRRTPEARYGAASLHISQTSLKAYPCSRPLHAAIDALRALLDETTFAVSELVALDVEIPSAGLNFVSARPAPKTAAEAQASATFVMWAAMEGVVTDPIIYREPSIRVWSVPPIPVHLRSSPDLDREFPARWGARVTIRTQGGAVASRLIATAPGDPERPLSHSDVQQKFRNLARQQLASDRTEEVLGVVAGIQELGDVSALRELLIGNEDNAQG